MLQAYHLYVFDIQYFTNVKGWYIMGKDRKVPFKAFGEWIKNMNLKNHQHHIDADPGS